MSSPAPKGSSVIDVEGDLPVPRLPGSLFQLRLFGLTRADARLLHLRRLRQDLPAKLPSQTAHAHAYRRKALCLPAMRQSFCQFITTKVHLGSVNFQKRSYVFYVYYIDIIVVAIIDRRHEKVHLSDKWWNCHLCDQSFGRKDHLDSHILTHAKSKPFACPVEVS